MEHESRITRAEPVLATPGRQRWTRAPGRRMARSRPDEVTTAAWSGSGIGALLPYVAT